MKKADCRRLWFKSFSVQVATAESTTEYTENTEGEKSREQTITGQPFPFPCDPCDPWFKSVSVQGGTVE